MIKSTAARLRIIYLGALAGVTGANLMMPVPITAYLCLIALAVGLALPFVWNGSVDAVWRDVAIVKPQPYETVLCWGCCYAMQDRDAPIQFLAHLDAEGDWRCDVTDAHLFAPMYWTRVTCPEAAREVIARRMGGMIRSGEPV